MTWIRRNRRGVKTYLLFEANGVVWSLIFKAQLAGVYSWEMYRIRGR